MFTCHDCIDRFKSWGDDPKVKSGRYGLSGCDYCNKPAYYRELERRTPASIEPIVKNVSYKVIEQMKGQIQYLKQKIQTSTKKKDTSYLYSSIIEDNAKDESMPEDIPF